MKELEEIRNDIDEIDHQIIDLYQQRLKLTTKVAEYKISVGKQVLDKKREEEKLNALCGLVNQEDVKSDIVDLYQQIMAISRKRQYQMMHKRGIIKNTGFHVVDELNVENARIVYQGAKGAYSQMAMQTFFGEETSAKAVHSWKDAMEAIQNNEADYAVLPIENSTAGIVSENYDLLVEYDNYIVGEQTIPIHHALIGLKESDMEQITCVYSHPQALMQCSEFLKQHHEIQAIPYENTATSAKKVQRDGQIHQAAIASPLTAEIYGLKILKEKINQSALNSTRFIIVSNQKVCVKHGDKISICFEVPHESGSLFHMLSHFIHNNLNLNKIESRPIKDKRFEYRFFVDFEGNIMDSAVVNALYGLETEAINLKILGNY